MRIQTYYGIMDTDHKELVMDESEHNNEDGTPLLFNSREFAEQVMNDIYPYCKVIKLKLSLDKN